MDHDGGAQEQSSDPSGSQTAAAVDLDPAKLARLAFELGSKKSNLPSQNHEAFTSPEFTAMMMEGVTSDTPPDHSHIELPRYQYEPLPNNSSIRVLRYVGEALGLPRYTFEVIDLEAEHPPYHCLTYTWFNPHADGNYFQESYAQRSASFTDKAWPIIVDDSLLFVHKNLHDALRQLPRTPWIERLNHRDSNGRALVHTWASTGAEGISTSDTDTAMALHALAKAGEGKGDIIHATAAAGGDVSLVDNEGRSALHLAAENGHIEMVKSLVNEGVDVGLRDAEGRTAAEYGLAGGHVAVAEYLENCPPGDSKPEPDLSRRPDDLVWIDAICINQEDMGEVQPQVGMMYQIYTEAVFVKVWLGEEDPLTQLCVGLIHKLEPHLDRIRTSNLIPYRSTGQDCLDEGFPEVSMSEWVALGGMYRRQWFRRAWVFQEMVSANDVVMFCGWQSIPYQTFLRLTTELLMKQQELGQPCSTFLVPPMDPAHLLELNLHVMAQYASLRGQARILRSPEAKARFMMSTLLRETRTFSASLPHDKVYSLLGLSTIATGIRGPVDYAMPVEVLYAIVARQIISESGSLNIFSDCIDSSFHKIEGLPSWAPDHSLTISMPIPVPYRASGDLQQQTRRLLRDTDSPFSTDSWYGLQVFIPALHETKAPSDERLRMVLEMARASFRPAKWNELHLQAAPVDKIIHVANPRSREANSSIRMDPSWFRLAERLDSTYRTGERRSEVFWRTLCGNHDQMTSRVPGASFGDQFRRSMCLIVCGEAQHRALKYGKLRTGALTMMEALLAVEQGRDHAVTVSTDGSVNGPYFTELQPFLDQLDALAAPEEGKKSFFPSSDEVRRFGTESDTDIFDDSGAMRANAFSQPFDVSFLAVYRTRRLYITEKGYLGLGPASLSPGDSVWIVPGHDKPVVLREHVTDEPRGNADGAVENMSPSEKEWKLIGETYVHGIMNGELVEDLQMEDIVLV